MPCGAVVSPVARKPHRRSRSYQESETSPIEASTSHGRRGILPFWGKKQAIGQGAAGDAGHSPRHTAQLFLPKTYNLSHNALSYDRGVLEDTMLNLEVFVTRLFDSLRGILRSILLAPAKSVKQPEAPMMQSRRASFNDMVRILTFHQGISSQQMSSRSLLAPTSHQSYSLVDNICMRWSVATNQFISLVHTHLTNMNVQLGSAEGGFARSGAWTAISRAEAGAAAHAKRWNDGLSTTEAGGAKGWRCLCG